MSKRCRRCKKSKAIDYYTRSDWNRKGSMCRKCQHEIWAERSAARIAAQKLEEQKAS